MQRLLFGASSAALVMAAALPASAQTASPGQDTAVDDIIVTAQRREQASQDVGIALNVLSGEDLKEKGVSVVNEIENIAPNVEVDSQFGGGQPQFRIRGIGATQYSANNTSSAGVYVDEVAHPYTITTQGALFDLARIEVLRGPQGTLYGRNTTAGAVNIITNAPTVDYRAGVTAEYGNYDRYMVEGYVSGQIAPGLRGRLAAVTEQGGGWQFSRDTGETLGDRDKSAVRGRLSWDLGPDATADLTASYMVDKSEGLGLRLRGPYAPATPALGPTIPTDTAWGVTGWSLSPALAAVSGRSVGDKPGRDNEGFDANLQVKADLGWADLTSLTAYQTFSRSEYNDWDGTRYQESDVYFYNDLSVVSQELRLASTGEGRWDWLVGVHAADETIDGGFYTQFRAVPTLINTPYTQHVQAAGIFTHNSFAFTDRFRLIAGLRYEYEVRELKTSGTTRAPTRPGPSLAYDNDLSEVSGRLGLEYDLTDSALLYASLARGVKSGGFTTYNATSATPFRPEIVLAYEVGLKSDWFDNRLRLNGALFYYDYTDQQIQGIEYDRISGRLGKITNVPKSKIYGGELELAWTPIDGLTLTQGYGYKDGEYSEFFAINDAATAAANPANGPWDTIIATDRSGEPLQFPKFTYSGSVAYDWALAGWALRAETSYYQRDDIYNASSASVLAGYTVWNGSVTVGPEDADWRVSLFGKNLFSEHYDETRNGFNGSARPTMSPNPPRTWGVRLSYEY
ncbi:TonB-dependent receptor [Brevundimonas sp. LM2]|uniref:TonB-dependent receptor n=1 Tax=Brevundimonas sp. LM2 TaxID=1938605 RepID=UPI000983D320|nr:TonB-dependent receptor [Brevundimonas sp. LM2]AQR61489.1 TonB-dependent receptor [Brevundimonas sp. LM2]